MSIIDKTYHNKFEQIFSQFIKTPSINISLYLNQTDLHNFQPYKRESTSMISSHKEMNTSAGRKVIRVKAVMKLNWLVMFDVPPLLTSIDRAVIHLFAASAQ